jgi:L-rhamnose-H+ transport protein
VLAGGFTTNFIWCLLLNIRNKTGYQYFHSKLRDGSNATPQGPVLETAVDAPGEEMAKQMESPREPVLHAPMLRNYALCGLAGTTWYFQFFFYTMGETQMGTYKFSSWTLHMASIIIFSTLWGIALHEWKGTSTLTKALVALSLCVLVSSTLIVGYGNYLGTAGGAILSIR